MKSGQILITESALIFIEGLSYGMTAVNALFDRVH